VSVVYGAYDWWDEQVIGHGFFHQGKKPFNGGALFSLENPFFERKCVDVA
jgi:hypothetical protein